MCIILNTMSIRMRHTKGHTGNRRSHHALKGPRLTLDKETNSYHLRHRVDMTTGMYRGKKILGTNKAAVVQAEPKKKSDDKKKKAE